MNIIKLATLTLILFSFISCGKTADKSATSTGYPEVSVKCGSEACVK